MWVFAIFFWAKAETLMFHTDVLTCWRQVKTFTLKFSLIYLYDPLLVEKLILPLSSAFQTYKANSIEFNFNWGSHCELLKARNSNGVKKYARDSQEDDLAVDVWSERERRGEGLLSEQAVALVQRRLLTILTQLLLPRGERLDVHELGASTQRIHPLLPLQTDAGSPGKAHCKHRGERKRNSCYKSNHVIFIYLFLLPSVWAQPRKPRLISGSKLSLNPACNNIMSRLEKMSSTPHQTQAWQLSVCPAHHCDDGTTFSNTEAHESVMDCNTGSCIRLMRVMTLSFFFFTALVIHYSSCVFLSAASL